MVVDASVVWADEVKDAGAGGEEEGGKSKVVFLMRALEALWASFNIFMGGFKKNKWLQIKNG